MTLSPRSTYAPTSAVPRTVGTALCRFAAVLAALALLSTLIARVAHAQDGTSTGLLVTSNDGTAHTYQAHKLLGGVVGSDGSAHDLTREGCVPDQAFLAAGATQDDLATPAALAEWLNKSGGDSSASEALAIALGKAVLAYETDQNVAPAATFASGEVAALDQGYWLVTSTDAQPMLVSVIEGSITTAQEKSTVPVPAKHVVQDQSTDTDAASNQSAASKSSGTTLTTNTCAGVGDVVAYRIEATLPTNLRSFTAYKLWLCDELSDGLAYVAKSVHPQVVHTDGTVEDVALKANIDGKSLRVGSDDLLAELPKLTSDDKIVVDYDCTVLPQATCGLSNGNNNALTLQYSRSPTTEDLGTQSVKTTVEVYSFQIDLHKVDPDGNALQGACFVMQNAQGKYRTASGTWSDESQDAQVVATNEAGVVSFAGLDEGTYTITETTAPEGYDLLASPVTVTLAASTAQTGNRALTATASGAGATVVAVDGATGVATVQVEDPKSSGSNTSTDSGSNNKGNNTGTGSGSNSGGGTPTSSAWDTVASMLPTTADPLTVVGAGVFVVSAGLVVAGVVKRRRNTAA